MHTGLDHALALSLLAEEREPGEMLSASRDRMCVYVLSETTQFTAA